MAFEQVSGSQYHGVVPGAVLRAPPGRVVNLLTSVITCPKLWIQLDCI